MVIWQQGIRTDFVQLRSFSGSTRRQKKVPGCSNNLRMCADWHNIVQILRFDPTWPQHGLHLGPTLANKAPTSAQTWTTWLQPAATWPQVGNTVGVFNRFHWSFPIFCCIDDASHWAMFPTSKCRKSPQVALSHPSCMETPTLALTRPKRVKPTQIWQNMARYLNMMDAMRCKQAKSSAHCAHICHLYGLDRFGAMFLHASPNGHAAITDLMAHFKGYSIPGSWNKSRRECRDSSRGPWPIPARASPPPRPANTHGAAYTLQALDAGLPFLCAIAVHPRNQMESTLSIARAVHQVPCSMNEDQSPKKSGQRIKRTVIMTEYDGVTCAHQWNMISWKYMKKK